MIPTDVPARIARKLEERAGCPAGCISCGRTADMLAASSPLTAPTLDRQETPTP